MLIGEPVAPEQVLLRYEITEWGQRWRQEGLTLAQARARCRQVHAGIVQRRGKEAGESWWKELMSQHPKLA